MELGARGQRPAHPLQEAYTLIRKVEQCEWLEIFNFQSLPSSARSSEAVTDTGISSWPGSHQSCPHLPGKGVLGGEGRIGCVPYSPVPFPSALPCLGQGSGPGGAESSRGAAVQGRRVQVAQGYRSHPLPVRSKFMFAWPACLVFLFLAARCLPKGTRSCLSCCLPSCPCCLTAV